MVVIVFTVGEREGWNGPSASRSRGIRMIRKALGSGICLVTVKD